MIRPAFFLVGLALFAYLVFHLGAGRIFSTVAHLGWNFVPVMLLYGCYQLARAAAMSGCFLDRRPAYWEILRIRFSGEAVQFLTFTGPLLAEPTKAWMLEKRGLASGEAFAVVLTEYLVYTFSSAALSVAGLTYLLGHYEIGGPMSAAFRVLIYANTLFLLVSAVAIVQRIYLIGAVVWGISRLPWVRTRFHPDMDAVHRMEDLLLVVLRERPRRFLAILAIELAAQFLLVLELYWILRSLDYQAAAITAWLVEATTKFISIAFFFIPAQMGAAEGVYTVVFQTLGLAGAAGFAISFARRLRSLVVAGAGLAAAWSVSRREG